MTIALRQPNHEVAHPHFTQEEVQIIKTIICQGITDDELSLFAKVCAQTGLNPFLKQIHPVKRKNKQKDGSYADVLTIQTAVDGYRLIADRSGRYCPGREPTFTYDKEGNLFSATGYIKKQTRDGTWHEVSATAIFSEYKPNYSNQFWDNKPHLMLAKCAEVAVIRKAFPNETSAIYSDEEMHQADKPLQNHVAKTEVLPALQQKEDPMPISSAQYDELYGLLELCSPAFQQSINDWLVKRKINSLQQLPAKDFDRFKENFAKNGLEYQQSITQVEDVLEAQV